tara:strand:+ start:5842 stop:6825 length:984 start_codon:yes stop_codon:yes gene_type:complete
MTGVAVPEIVEEKLDDKMVTLEFASVELRKDDEDKEYMNIRALALDEGVWNGIYFAADDIGEKISMLEGRRVLVSHEFETPDDVKGWVESVDSEGFAGLKVFDSNTISRVKSGELNSVSVGVQIQTKNGMATIMDFNEISLTGNPACKSCEITDFSVATLEEEGAEIEMTEEEIVEETNEELCECEPELEEEAPVVEQNDFQKDDTAELENIELKAQMEAMSSQIAELEAHKASLEHEKHVAEIDARVSILMDEGRFKPSHSAELHTFLLSLNEEQMTLWEGAEAGLGAVVPLDDLADAAEFSPEEAAMSQLEKDKREFRQKMGFKE